MIEGIIALLLVVFAAFGPIKWAYSAALATSYTLFYFLINDVSTIMFLILLFRVLSNGQFQIQLQDKLLKGHILFVIFAAISILWSSSSLVTIGLLIALIKGIIIGYVTLNIFNSRLDIKYLVSSVSIGWVILVACLLSWKNGLFGVSPSVYAANMAEFDRLLIQYLFPNRHTPINSNTWASLVTLSAGIMSAYIYYNSKRKMGKMILIGVIIAISIISVDDLKTRAATLAIIAAIVAIFFIHTPRKFFLYSVILGVTFLSGNFLIQTISSLLPDSDVLERLEDSDKDPRTKIWAVGLKMGADNILTGVGLGSASIQFKEYADNIHEFHSDKLAMHNSFITYLAELGVFGLLLFLRLFYIWGRVSLNYQFSQVLFIIISFNILINAFAHSFEMENYFIAIIYFSYRFFQIEQSEKNNSRRFHYKSPQTMGKSLITQL